MDKLKKENIKSFVGENLNRFRKANGYSLDDVVYSTGLSKSYLSQLENGQSKKPSIETAYILWKVIKDDGIQEPFTQFCFNPIGEERLIN